MFDKSVVIDLFGLVGSRNPLDPLLAILDAPNQESRSGHFATDNPFCKIKSLKESQDYIDISDADFNTLLKRMQEGAISSVCSAVFSNPDFIDKDLIYKYAQNKQNTENLPDGFIGYKIVSHSDHDVAFEINRVILDFSGTGSITLMLFNTGSLGLVESKVINIASDNQEERLNWVVNNSGSTYKGDYYIGYNTTGLSVAPYSRDYQNSSIMSPFRDVHISKIAVAGHDSSTLFDLNDVNSTSITNGLNLDISVYKDYTELIRNNQATFAKAILLSFQIAFISEYASTVRHNEDTVLAQGLVRFIQEVEGQNDQGNVKITGLKPLLIKELSFIKKEIKRLSDGFEPNDIKIITLG